MACQFSKDGLDGHLLATSDEQGQVLLMDTRKRAQQSVIEGTSGVVSHQTLKKKGLVPLEVNLDLILEVWNLNGFYRLGSVLSGTRL